MPDLNHILLFVAWISSSVLLARTWRGGVDSIWRRPALAVLLVAVLATVFARPRGGWIAGGAWVALLLVPAIALRKALELAERGKFKRAHTLLNLLRPVHPGKSLREHHRWIDAIEAAHAQGRVLRGRAARPMIFGRARVPMTRAVAILIGLNVAMFAAEIALGGSTNPGTLHRLGALEPYGVFALGQYWRLLTAPFLHYGALHLLVNLLALYYFGPTLERMIGSARFAVSYLICGVASCAEVAILWRLGWFRADQLVGASGAVMGIVGTWAGALLRERHLTHNRNALRSILVIIVVQSTFDLLTPQVSMAAHLGGLVAGVLAGLLFTPRRTPGRPSV